MELIKENTQSQLVKSLLIIFIGSIILTVSAKIKIPFYPVPMTMQTFIVLFLGISFGYKIALATVSLYLLEGILGLPVFSNSRASLISIKLQLFSSTILNASSALIVLISRIVSETNV